MKRKVSREISDDESLDGEDLSQKVKSISLEPQSAESDYCDDQENSDRERQSSCKNASGTKVLGMRRVKSVIKNDHAFKPMPRLGGQSKDARKTLLKPFSIPTFKSGRSHLAGGVRYGNTLGMRRGVMQRKGPLHDPEEEGAIVLYVPKIVLTVAQQFSFNFKKDSKDPEGEVPVVVDPILGRVLRPHQIEGVRFLYECVNGHKAENMYGCIMADEMVILLNIMNRGSAKHYNDSIALLWTLLRQSPHPGKPTIEKAIIVCPSSLVKNWANELIKWLGENRIRPYACDGKGTKDQTIKDLEQFVSAKGRGIVNSVLIISYETLRIYTSILIKTEIGLILCDEGHRLKNADSLTYQTLNSLNAKRRVILSGTPIQNDLTEYFSLLSFAIPNVLGTVPEFRKRFELPILRGRDADASDKERKESEEKLSELLGIANKFIIRRTAELLTKYLPVKYEYVVFCKLQPEQLNSYKTISTSKDFIAVTTPLQIITILKKLCNHPSLLTERDIGDIIELPRYDDRNPQSDLSGKMGLLDRMLIKLRKTTSDKIVLISNYTQTLDFMEALCRFRKYGVCRLDGTMTVQKRQKLVDRFNDPNGSEFVFLLSSKAGGCGINLVGANRLILFDPDWNPASDAQALARVWRDGQKKMCFIYRFITTGTIEEKIFQRQAHKQSLSSCVVDEEQDVERHFSLESLRDLFQLKENTLCDTHDTFKCKRCKDGKQFVKPPEGTINTGATAADTSTWNHFSQLELGKIYDPILKEESSTNGTVTFVFQNKVLIMIF